ncbi:MAG: flagellar biosynthesis anti-sigma factor FlgM [Oscillospiraceae bacterium]|jgi:flagellar biosynthesis anti-sigma factor FlgM|nr:flagellar biosynthesis anti-sigma factor FlgM [Oscillospiraceae bacterium]
MKIDPIAKVDYVQQIYANPTKTAETDTRRNNADKVTFSSEAVTFSKALGAAKANAIESDNEKISAVKAQIESGTYNVGADKIAESILLRFQQ